jgi:5-methylcytosine-specific restriction enzyme A
MSVRILKPTQHKPATSPYDDGSKRLRGRKLQTLRERIFQRQNHLCLECLKQNRLRQCEELDHITPLCQGGTDDESNLAGLCHDCHQAKTQAQRGHRGDL